MKTDNELIAEFMGKPLTIERYVGNERSDHKINYDGYYKQWNNLMPVVEKIENGDNWVFTIFNKQVWLTESEHRFTAKGKRFEYTGESKIESVYKLVVEFIKWYNQQKP